MTSHGLSTSPSIGARVVGKVVIVGVAVAKIGVAVGGFGVGVAVGGTGVGVDVGGIGVGASVDVTVLVGVSVGIGVAVALALTATGVSGASVADSSVVDSLHPVKTSVTINSPVETYGQNCIIIEFPSIDS